MQENYKLLFIKSEPYDFLATDGKQLKGVNHVHYVIDSRGDILPLKMKERILSEDVVTEQVANLPSVKVEYGIFLDRKTGKQNLNPKTMVLI